MEKKTSLVEILDYIHPSDLDYTEWVNIGMALKHEGYSVDLWDSWSSKDVSRYHRGECVRKWNTFTGSSSPVTGGTIVQMAMERGWEPQRGRELDWNDTIRNDDSRVVLDSSWIEEQEVREPEEWDPVKELITYLETLFGTDEKVGYVTRSWSKPDDDKKYPDKGSWDRTARQLIQKLSKCKGDVGAVLGDYDPEAGAWIRFNPLDGNGCKNTNVTEYRYALVESDNTPISRQNALIRELELPVACLVHSGGKSLHAIVRIEAANYEEYRKRVDYLYKICQKNGIDVDTQNKNPSRLSRMPGVLRNGKKQFLVATNIGKQSWEEWYEWIEAVNDNLPDPEDLESVWNDLPELAPCLIEGILRKGHKMLIAGPSKAGKSFLLIELCVCIAEGKSWIGWKCAQGKVLYVNLELDRASCLHRFKDVYESMGIRPEHLNNIDIWNLRGKSVPMDKLAPKLIRRAAKKRYTAIIIDPIYKVITGDENSADQMANFCNQFDLVCTELNSAVIYCHHHSKGSQGGKKSMDRASGSGVFARDPDALLDLIELEPTEALMKQQGDKAYCRKLFSCLPESSQEEISLDDMESKTQINIRADELIKERKLKDYQKNYARKEAETAEKLARAKTAWRIEGTLREFPKFEPVNLWFDYPSHRIDDVGVLADLQADTEKPPWQKGSDKIKKNAKDRKQERRKALEEAVNDSNFGEPPTVKEVAEFLGISERTARDRIKEHGNYICEDGKVVKKNHGEN